MFTSVCTTSSYWRMLEEEGGEKRKKSQTGSHKVQLEPSSALLDLLQFKNKRNLHPFAPLETLGIRQTMQKAQTKSKQQLQWEHRNPTKPSTKELNPSHPHPEQKSRAGFKLAPGQAQSKTAPLTDLFHMCPLKPGRGGSAQESGQQLRADGTATSQRRPISLAPRRTCSHTHLDSSPVASTPKCSHTAGQNCSLQVMKSSSKLARAKERFNNPAQGRTKGYSQRSHLKSLWTSSFTMGKGTCPWIQAILICLHAHRSPEEYLQMTKWVGGNCCYTSHSSLHQVCQGRLCYSDWLFKQLGSRLPTPGIRSPS